MSNYQVAKENLTKVEGFFVNKVIQTQDDHITAKVKEIADGSGVALATAHKAIKELISQGILLSIRPKSRRFTTVYIYRGDIKLFIEKQEEEKRLDSLSKLADIQRKEIERLKKLRDDLLRS